MSLVLLKVDYAYFADHLTIAFTRTDSEMQKVGTRYNRHETVFKYCNAVLPLSPRSPSSRCRLLCF